LRGFLTSHSIIKSQSPRFKKNRRNIMSTLLRIDSSSRLQGSHSRALADHLQAQWLASHTGGKVILRDLVKTPIPHILDITIAGYYTPTDQHTPELRAAVALSDELIAELLSADTLLFSIPLYNFSIPSALKAYIDHTVRIGQTFGHDEKTGLFGLVEGKKAYVTASYGASGYVGGSLASYNFLEPYYEGVARLYRHQRRYVLLCRRYVHRSRHTRCDAGKGIGGDRACRHGMKPRVLSQNTNGENYNIRRNDHCRRAGR